MGLKYAIRLLARVSFKYDPFSRRIYKSSSSGTSALAYDGNNLIEETNSGGTTVARYAQGIDIDEPLAMLRSSTTSYYAADGLGSITSLSNSSGANAATYAYDSFGNVATSLAAYNAGPGAVNTAGGIPNFPETKNYVKKINDCLEKKGLKGGVNDPGATGGCECK